MSWQLLLAIWFLLTPAVFAQEGQVVPPVLATEEDGSPECFVTYTMKFANGNVTDNGDGSCSIADSGAGGGNSFETIDVPAGTDPVADSSTDTLTITETSFLTLTGTAGTDTIDITQVTTDLGTDGLIAANAVALGTDTTNAYVADLTAGTYIDVSGGGAETATVTVDVDATEILDVTFAAGANASQTWTWNLSGTDPQATFGSDALTLNIEDVTVQGAGPNLSLDPDSGDTFGFHVDPTTSISFLNNETDGVHYLEFGGNHSIDIGASGGGSSLVPFIRLTTDGTGDAELQVPSASISPAEASTALRTDTKCYRVPDPTAADDDKSIWFTTNAFTISSLWAESDQTVNLMVQVDDGTPSDVDTVDLAPAAGTAQDILLNGDTTMQAGDRLDLDIASVSGTPTWVTICWTGTFDDD